MARHHIPDLNALQNLADPEVQFYSVIGAVVSLAAALDLVYVDLFAKGAGLDRASAGRILFKAKNSSLQRDMAIEAIEGKIANDGALLDTWRPLCQRLKEATGQRGLRHLIAHNTVTRYEIDGTVGGAPVGALVLGGDGEVTFHVFQDHLKVLAGQKPRQAAIHRLIAFARELVTLIDDLDNFLDCAL